MSKLTTRLNLLLKNHKHCVVFSTQKLGNASSQTWATLKSSKMLLLNRILTILDDSETFNATFPNFTKGLINEENAHL